MLGNKIRTSGKHSWLCSLRRSNKSSKIDRLLQSVHPEGATVEAEGDDWPGEVTESVSRPASLPLACMHLQMIAERGCSWSQLDRDGLRG
mmetsp:Transcript_92458/g.298845  ORF Transcript_92458/g.298845 Transcript_92458/m.298845 type:complete len:90 (+) Transcript_92458:3188-3457(+)